MPRKPKARPPHYQPGVPLAFLDVETTGLSPASGHRICEIAILRCESDGRESAFESLVNPKRRISAGAFAVNGITADMVRGAPQFAELIPAIDELLDGAVLVAHNAPFDLGFLSAEQERAGVERQYPQVLDTLEIARAVLPDMPHDLPTLRRALGVRVAGAHRALADCRATRGVLDALIARFWIDGPPSIESLLKIGLTFEPDPIPIDLLPADLADALRRCPRIWIEYKGADGAYSERWIEVRGAAQAGKHAYLVAFCEERQAERHFRLDRILDWQPDGHARPDGEDVIVYKPRYERPADTAPSIRSMSAMEVATLPAFWKECGLRCKPTGRDRVDRLLVQYNGNHGGFIGAFVGSRMVGSVIATDDTRRGWINRLAVHPDYRGQGLARKLIAAAETYLRGRGREVFDALIDADNAASLRLFAREGYAEKPDILYFTKRSSPDV